MIEKKLSNATPLDDENVVLRRSDNNFLNKTQITNCILEAPNGVMTYNDTTFTLKAGLKFLIPNSRNEDKTLKNIEYTVPENKTINYTGVGNKTFDFTLLYGNTSTWALSQNYQEADTPPTFYGHSQYYLNTKENIMYFNNNNETWEPETVAVLGKGRLENGVIVSFTPYQPFRAVDYNDTGFIAHQAMPSEYIEDISGQISVGTGNFPLNTAPADGFLFWYVDNVPANVSLFINTYVSSASSNITHEDVIFSIKAQDNYKSNMTVGFVPIAKGQKYALHANSPNYGTNIWCQFIYAKGAIS